MAFFYDSVNGKSGQIKSQASVGRYRQQGPHLPAQTQSIGPQQRIGPAFLGIVALITRRAVAWKREGQSTPVSRAHCFSAFLIPKSSPEMEVAPILVGESTPSAASNLF